MKRVDYQRNTHKCAYNFRQLPSSLLEEGKIEGEGEREGGFENWSTLLDFA
jgi:hypothetical protein